jgi:hypothetical protein
LANNCNCSDGEGNIYITGSFGGSCNFGSQTITQTRTGYLDFFITKFDSNGQCLWAKQTNGGNYGNGGEILIYKNSVYITDNYIAPITFGAGSDTTTLTTHGGSIFVAKYNTLGVFQWAKQVSDSGECQSKGIVVDDFENIYVSGWYSRKVKFEQSLLTCNHTNAFIIKYDNNGLFKWVKQPLNIAGSLID